VRASKFRHGSARCWRWARKRLGGELTAFEVMWNSYYRLTTELVKGVVRPLPANHPLYVLFEAIGQRCGNDFGPVSKSCWKRRSAKKKSSSMPRFASSGAAAAAIWRIRDSSVELGRARSGRPASASMSAWPSTGWKRSSMPLARA